MAISIDDAWLAANGGANGPWLLTLANTTYDLTMNPTATGTGFLVKASGITLNLNGRTVTFGSRANPTLLNPFFDLETITPGKPDYWNHSGAASAAVVAISDNTNTLKGFRDWAAKCLKLASFNTTQILTSSNVAILANIEYCASVFARATTNTASSGLNLRIEVIDSVTSAVLGTTNTNTGVGSGYCEPCFFVSTTGNAVYLRITAIPPTGLSTTVYLSWAAIEQSRDYGILATGRYGGSGSPTGGSINSVGTTIANQLVTGIGGSPRYTMLPGTATFTLVGPGSIVCSNNGYASIPVVARNIGVVSITNITAQTAGMDAPIIQAIGSKPTVTGCTTNDGGTRVGNRQRQFGDIDAGSVTGNTNISNNTLNLCKFSGIYITGQSLPAGIVPLIENNTIYPATRYTDGYGITGATFPYGITVRNNTIDSTVAGGNGRGILIDLFLPFLSSDGVVIHGNTITLYETWNLEYGRNGFETTGIRLRNHPTQNSTNYQVYDNIVTVYTDAAGNHAAIGIRPGFFNSVDCAFTIRDNTVVAYSADSSTTNQAVTWAAALSIDGLAAPGGLTVVNNTFESNVISVDTSDVDLYNQTVSGIVFRNNILKKSALGNTGYTHIPVRIGYFSDGLANTQLIGSTFTGGATGYTFSSDNSWGNGVQDKQFLVGWEVTVTVTNSATGLPIAGAACQTTNVNDVADDGQMTNAVGVARVYCLTDLWHQPGTNAGGRTNTSYAPHTLTVSAAGYVTQAVSLGSLSANTTRSISLVPVGGGGNTAPSLFGVPSSATIQELSPYTFTATATDPDLPPQTLTFSLVGAPAGAAIGASSGVFVWTPTEAQGPGVYPFMVRVSDGIANTDASITLTVTEVNTTPTLSGVPASATIYTRVLYTFTASATDSDLPANTLTYSLASAPSGAAINSSTGVFTWTPTRSQAPAVYTFSVRVSDGTTMANRSITLTVSNGVPPTRRFALPATDTTTAVLPASVTRRRPT